MSHSGEEQRSIIRYVAGPLVVLGGPGTGKTTLLAEKAVWLVREYGMDARQIALLAPTPCGAELLARHLHTGPGLTDLRRITALSVLALEILRTQPRLPGHGVYSLYDDDDSLHLIGDLIRREGIRGEATPAAVQARILAWKRAGQAPEDLSWLPGRGSLDDVAARLYEIYEATLRRHRALDTADPCFQVARLLEQDHGIASAWRGRIRGLLVDDAHATTEVERRFLRLLAGPEGILTIALDPVTAPAHDSEDSASVADRIVSGFPTAIVKTLTHCHRSTVRLLRAAQGLMRHQSVGGMGSGLETSLWTDNDLGGPVRVLRARDEEQEAELIVRTLEQHRNTTGARYADYAILYRAPHQAPALEMQLRDYRIPYVHETIDDFYSRTEIRDFLAYLRLIANPADDSAFLRVVNTPRREIPGEALATLVRHAADTGVSLLEAARDPLLDLKCPSASLTALRGFGQWVEQHIRRAAGQTPCHVACEVLAELRYEDWLHDSSNDRRLGRRRMANVLEFVATLRAMEHSGCRSLGEAVLQISLDALHGRTALTPREERVTLLDIERAAGIEFDHVLIAGVEEGILPALGDESTGAIASERALACLAMTRARRTLWVSCAEHRHRHGEIVDTRPSRFLTEIPPSELSFEGNAVTSAAGSVPDRVARYLATLE